jgi:hypothetical protein
MSTGAKTKQPIAYAKTKVVYDKLVKENMAKGYTNQFRAIPAMPLW